MAAVADVVAEKGYTGATIGEIAARAGVSRRTFYEHFTDKEDCYLAAYDVMVETLFSRMQAELEERQGEDWRALAARVLNAYMTTLTDEPAVTRAFLLEVQAAGVKARRRRTEVHREFATLLASAHELIRRRDPSLAPLPERIYLAVVGGVSNLVCEMLEQSAKEPLSSIEQDILLWIVATVEGAATAIEALEAAVGPAARAG